MNRNWSLWSARLATVCDEVGALKNQAPEIGPSTSNNGIDRVLTAVSGQAEGTGGQGLRVLLLVYLHMASMIQTGNSTSLYLVSMKVQRVLLDLTVSLRILSRLFHAWLTPLMQCLSEITSDWVSIGLTRHDLGQS